ncbi:MAG: hypothetical protein KGH83_03425 [Thaumarchaeota archaeon]|nr:hypothetical protein [Nitrososphaerota archaeon]
MKKFENLTTASQKGETENTNGRDKMLWWMQKGRNAIYVQFVNGIHMI